MIDKADVLKIISDVYYLPKFDRKRNREMTEFIIELEKRIKKLEAEK